MADGRAHTFGGRARCGMDLTEVIDESPYGRSKQQLLKKVGTFDADGAARIILAVNYVC